MVTFLRGLVVGWCVFLMSFWCSFAAYEPAPQDEVLLDMLLPMIEKLEWEEKKLITGILENALKKFEAWTRKHRFAEKLHNWIWHTFIHVDGDDLIDTWSYATMWDPVSNVTDVSSTSVQIETTSVIHNGHEVYEYRVYYSPESLALQKLSLVPSSIVSVTSFSDWWDFAHITLEWLTPNTTYYYVITPFDTDDSRETWSMFTDQKEFTTTWVSSSPVKNWDSIGVHYIWSLEDGSIFDTSRGDIAKDAGLYDARRTYVPLEFTVWAGQMIAWFDAGVVGMSIWEKKTLIIPPEDAYGTSWSHFLAGKTLIFDVEIVTIWE